MSFKDELLRHLSGPEFDVSPSTVAAGVAQVIKGQTVKRKYKVVGGQRRLVEETVLVTPKDAMTGAMIYDALHGGSLGLAPSEYRKLSGQEQGTVHRRLTVDNRIIATREEDEPGAE